MKFFNKTVGFERAEEENAPFGSIFPPRRDSDRRERRDFFAITAESTCMNTELMRVFEENVNCC